MAKRPGVSGGRRPEVPGQGQRAAVAAQTTGERRPLLTTSVGTAGWGWGAVTSCQLRGWELRTPDLEEGPAGVRFTLFWKTSENTGCVWTFKLLQLGDALGTEKGLVRRAPLKNLVITYWCKSP